MDEVHINYCERVGLFYANFLPDCFCAFLLEHSLTSQVTFSRFRSAFLSDLYCSHSEVKHSNKKGLIDEWAVHLIMGRDLNGSNPGGVKCFSNRLSFESNSSVISWFMF